MAVKIRLKRTGRKKQPSFRIVVTESRNPRNGESIESVGYYIPYLKDKPLKVDLERVDAWLKKGAVPSEAVKRLLRIVRSGSSNAPVKVKVKPVKDEADPVPPEEAPGNSGRESM